MTAIIISVSVLVFSVACAKTDNNLSADSDNNDTNIAVGEDLTDLLPSNKVPSDLLPSNKIPSDLTPAYKAGETAYNILHEFNDTYSTRNAGQESEKLAATYISSKLNGFGYKSEMQEFTYTKKGTSYNSQNVVATKKAKTDNAKDIVIGAHYDSVDAAKGIDDNASGVAVMLESAMYLFDKETSYDITFIAFGAEETGLNGSFAYVDGLTEEQLAEIELMINLDTLAAGDFMYAYGGADEKSQNILSNLLAYSVKKDLFLTTQDGSTFPEDYPYGTTGDWSDHVAFKYAGVPVIYFEGSNWDIGDTGESQTTTVMPDGSQTIMHTTNDSLEVIEKVFPGRVQLHMQNFTKAVTALAMSSAL